MNELPNTVIVPPLPLPPSPRPPRSLSWGNLLMASLLTLVLAVGASIIVSFLLSRAASTNDTNVLLTQVGDMQLTAVVYAVATVRAMDGTTDSTQDVLSQVAATQEATDSIEDVPTEDAASAAGATSPDEPTEDATADLTVSTTEPTEDATADLTVPTEEATDDAAVSGVASASPVIMPTETPVPSDTPIPLPTNTQVPEIVLNASGHSAPVIYVGNLKPLKLILSSPSDNAPDSLMLSSRLGGFATVDDCSQEILETQEIFFGARAPVEIFFCMPSALETESQATIEVKTPDETLLLNSLFVQVKHELIQPELIQISSAELATSSRSIECPAPQSITIDGTIVNNPRAIPFTLSLITASSITVPRQYQISLSGKLPAAAKSEATAEATSDQETGETESETSANEDAAALLPKGVIQLFASNEDRANCSPIFTREGAAIIDMPTPVLLEPGQRLWGYYLLPTATAANPDVFPMLTAAPLPVLGQPVTLQLNPIGIVNTTIPLKIWEDDLTTAITDLPYLNTEGNVPRGTSFIIVGQKTDKSSPYLQVYIDASKSLGWVRKDFFDIVGENLIPTIDPAS